MKKIIGVLAVLFIAASSTFADDDLFSRIDKNKDGKISKQEFMDAHTADFDKLDKNKDGMLTRDELKTTDKNAVKKLMKKADKNKDGKISREESGRVAEERFQFLDKNKDGFIDQKEWNDMKDGISRNSKVAPVSPLMIFSF